MNLVLFQQDFYRFNLGKMYTLIESSMQFSIFQLSLTFVYKSIVFFTNSAIFKCAELVYLVLFDYIFLVVLRGIFFLFK